MVDFNYFNPQPKQYTPPKEKKGLKKGKREPTGELALFSMLYLKRKGRCEITGEKIEFHPINFLHVLSKGAYPRFRLKEENIFMVIEDIHTLYDCSSREFLLSKYPKAKIIYERKDALKTEYYLKPPTI